MDFIEMEKMSMSMLIYTNLLLMLQCLNSKSSLKLIKNYSCHLDKYR